MKYLLDSSTYLEAKIRYYQMDFCPAYWEWLDHQFNSGNLGSISMVYDELKGFDDGLSDWVKKRKHQFFDVYDDKTQEQYSEIVNYIMTLKNMNQGDVQKFLAKADPWLIAKAKVLNAVVVTQEVAVEQNSKKVKIPNICLKFGVEYINTFQLLQQLNACFVMK